MKTIHCSNCGAAAELTRGNYEFRESGLDYVTLNNIELITCSVCGNRDPIIRKPKKLTEQLLIGVASKRSRLEGQDVRFIRKHLRLTQEQFSQLIHTDKTTISKWENDADPVGQISDLLIRSVAITLSNASKDVERSIVRRFSDIAFEHMATHMNFDAEKDYEATRAQWDSNPSLLAQKTVSTGTLPTNAGKKMVNKHLCLQ